MLYDGSTFTHDGFNFRVSFPEDDFGDTPWEREDGHGPVSEWKHRDAFGQGSKPPKSPGEMILCWDNGSYRTYDFAEACRIARKDGWGWMPGKLTYRELATGQWEAKADALTAYGTNVNEALNGLYALVRQRFSPRAIAAKAAMDDFNRLRRWCDNQWCYVGVVVELLDDEGEPMGETESVWGIESDADEYLTETAHELASEVIARLQSAAA